MRSDQASKRPAENIEPYFGVTDRVKGGQHTVVVTGEVDLETTPRLRRVLLDAIDDSDATQVVIDCRDVVFADSTAIGTFVLARNEAMSRDIELMLAEPSPAITQPLAITGLTESFPVIDLHPSPFPSPKADTPKADATG